MIQANSESFSWRDAQMRFCYALGGQRIR